MPSGAITMMGGSSVPSGWLYCDGAAISRTTYSALFTAIGTTYGTGDGSTTFNLPNFKGSVPVGTDTSQTEFNANGKTGGEKTHVLTVAELATHSHVFSYSGSPATDYPTWPLANSTYPGGGNVSFTQSTAGSGTVGIKTAGSNTAHNNLQPYLTVNFIIKA
jgi:microcystin-dependent protein